MPQLPAITPRPVHVRLLDGPPIELGRGSRFLTGTSPDEVAMGIVLASLLGGLVGFPVPVVHVDDASLVDAESMAGAVVLRLDPLAGPPEASPDERYELRASGTSIVLRAPRPAGLGRALSTLRQLAVVTGTGQYTVPAVHVSDAPRYAWRGLSIDVARHFFTVSQMKVVIGLMSLYKLNVLHLHLTDDQGWRLQVPSRPLLTERSGHTAVGDAPGGFYSAQDFSELIAFADARQITLVPEIDVPGHVNAALHAYGDLSADGRRTPAYTGVEVGFSALDLSLPATETFLKDVLTDVARMTRGPYVHIGGDEVLTMAEPEYAAFVELAARIVTEAGKSVVGWQEVARVPVPVGTVVQMWDPRAGTESIVAAAKAGAKVLLSPADRVYLDMKYTKETFLGTEWSGYVELRDSYEWDPETLVPGLPADAVIGIEAAVWTESLTSLDDLTYMLLPRLVAAAEVAWTPTQERRWPDFAARLKFESRHWDNLGIAWYPSPQVGW